MGARIRIDIPKSLHAALSRISARSGISIPTLVVRAVERAYGDQQSRPYIAGPLVAGKAPLGPAFPEDENPHDFVFSD